MRLWKRSDPDGKPAGPRSHPRIAALMLAVVAMLVSFVALTHVSGGLRSLASMVLHVVNLPWPTWIANIANLLQILSAGAAIVLAWRGIRAGARASERTRGRG
ncbi:MAG TPA: hypothetical protein VLW53_01240 [Candidatus Eisenbacteria bacterium]|nr:hypothetical protein [Candidatus Eisenbacteria bacterium]